MRNRPRLAARRDLSREIVRRRDELAGRRDEDAARDVREARARIVDAESVEVRFRDGRTVTATLHGGFFAAALPDSEGPMPTVVGLTPTTVYESVAGGPVRTRPR